MFNYPAAIPQSKRPHISSQTISTTPSFANFPPTVMPYKTAIHPVGGHTKNQLNVNRVSPVQVLDMFGLFHIVYFTVLLQIRVPRILTPVSASEGLYATAHLHYCLQPNLPPSFLSHPCHTRDYEPCQQNPRIVTRGISSPHFPIIFTNHF